MRNQNIYPYAEGLLLDTPHTYQYSDFYGMGFLNGWFEHRKEILDELPTPESPPTPNGIYPLKKNSRYTAGFLLESTMMGLSQNAYTKNPEFKELLRTLVKKFEVSKRIFNDYSSDFTPIDRTAYHDIRHYLRFAELLECAYTLSNEFPFLNALLKVIDILIAYRSELSIEEEARLAWLISREREHICRCGYNLGVLSCI